MTSCTDIQDALSAYLDRELPAPEREGIDAHLKRCASCRALLEELSAVDRFLRAEPAPAGGDLKAKLRALLGGDLAGPPPPAAPYRMPAPAGPPWYAGPEGLIAATLVSITIACFWSWSSNPVTVAVTPTRAASAAPRPSPPAPLALRAELAAMARELDALDRDVRSFRTDAVRAAGDGHQRVLSRRFEEWK